MKSIFSKCSRIRTYFLTAALGCTPTLAFAGVETMMSNLQSAILGILAPMICVGGIIFSGFKLAMGDESAKRTLFWSCVGTVITFTAPGILTFLQHQVASQG